MGANLTAKRLLVGLIVTFLLTGCAAAATPSPPATAAATTSVAVATPALTPTPTPTPFVGAAVLTITCDGTAARLDATAVRAMPDGVHVDASATDGAPATVDVLAGDEGVVATTRGAAALVLAPGPYHVACLDPAEGDGPAVSFVIGDPDGLWKSSDTTCADGSGTAGSGDGPPASPAAAIAYLRTLVPLRQYDILEPAGYPEAPSGWIRLVRDGQVVASWQVQGTGDALRVNSTRTCPEPTSLAPTQSPPPTSSPEPSTPLGPPAAPTGATYHDDRFTGLKDVTVTAAWNEASPNGVSIWVYAVTECLAPAGSDRVDCVTEGSKIPASALVVLRKVPAAAGTTAWTFTDYNIGGALGVYGPVEYYAIILRAVSKAGQSPFVVAGTAQSCYQCTY